MSSVAKYSSAQYQRMGSDILDGHMTIQQTCKKYKISIPTVRIQVRKVLAARKDLAINSETKTDDTILSLKNESAKPYEMPADVAMFIEFMAFKTMLKRCGIHAVSTT